VVVGGRETEFSDKTNEMARSKGGNWSFKYPLRHERRCLKGGGECRQFLLGELSNQKRDF